MAKFITLSQLRTAITRVKSELCKRDTAIDNLEEVMTTAIFDLSDKIDVTEAVTANALNDLDRRIKSVDSNTLKEIEAEAGEDIGSVGTPSVTATTADGKTTLTFHNLKGTKGDQGIQGIQGIQGQEGKKGDKGDTGSVADLIHSGDGNVVESVTMDTDKVLRVAKTFKAVSQAEHEELARITAGALNDLDQRITKAQDTLNNLPTPEQCRCNEEHCNIAYENIHFTASLASDDPHCQFIQSGNGIPLTILDGYARYGLETKSSQDDRRDLMVNLELYMCGDVNWEFITNREGGNSTNQIVVLRDVGCMVAVNNVGIEPLNLLGSLVLHVNPIMQSKTDHYDGLIHLSGHFYMEYNEQEYAHLSYRDVEAFFNNETEFEFNI